MDKRRWIFAGSFVGALLLGALVVLYLNMKHGAESLHPIVKQTAAPTYVGAAACKSCHAQQYRDWLGSHHQQAMQEATAATVLGNFADASFKYFGVTSRFYSRDGRFFVNTEGGDGKPHEYEIRYTFGVHPLQQYLVAFPDGRIQALPIAWDARSAEQGGQKWFHLYPAEQIRAGDELHWTNLQQNWNYTCAECHSTNLQKGYDETNNSYRTSWTDISVSCEACHGAGSAHVAWARHAESGTAPADVLAGDGLLAHFESPRGNWILDAATGNSHRSHPRGGADEVEVCGRCHARGAKISEDWIAGKPLLDTHLVALLEKGLYTADGQMQDEVYNYGSFLQSKMYAAGVICTDCHEPHTQKLRTTNQEVCGLCHALSRFGSAEHHHHREGSAESRCVSCHMPVRTYMVVDARHDHSFRIPRPEDSVRFGTPNACSDCHKNQTPAWAAQAVRSWYGAGYPPYQRFTAALSAARSESATAAALLLQTVRDPSTPTIARATALGELANYLDPDSLNASEEALHSPDALVRLAAVELLGAVDATTRWGSLAPLLNDPVRAVRTAAADELVDCVPPDATADAQKALQQALDEYIATQKLNADRPEAHLNLGELYSRQGKTQDAGTEYRQAIRLQPHFVLAYINLADLSRAQQRDDLAEQWLTQAADFAPDNAQLLMALGMLRVRQHRDADSLPFLRQAAGIASDSAHYQYVYGVALYSTGQPAAGLKVLRAASEKFPANRELLLGLASLSADTGDDSAARRYAQRFVEVAPADPRGRQMLNQLGPAPR